MIRRSAHVPERPVPRFFFDVVDATRSMPDEAGLDCRDLGEAHHQACALIEEAMEGPETVRVDWHHWRFEVSDEARRLLFTVPFPQRID